MLSDLLQVDVIRERHGASVDAKDLQACLGVRYANFDFAIEATGTPQRRIKHLGNVGRPDDDDLTARHKAVHQTEKLCHNAFLNLASDFGALGSHGVDLVDEKNGGRVTRRFLEDLAEFGLAFAVELPHDLRAVQVNEMHTTFGCYGTGKQGLARAWRAVQQHTLRCQNPQPLEDARVFERQFNDFAHAGHFMLEAADIFIRHRRSAGGGVLAFDDADVGVLSDHYNARWNRTYNLEVHCLGKRRHTHYTTRDDRNSHQILKHSVGCNGCRRSSYP